MSELNPMRFLCLKDIENIERTYKLFEDQTHSFANYFYKCLFELSPLIRPMFKKNIHIQEIHFASLMQLTIELINSKSCLESALIPLAIRHKNYGVELIHFDVVKSAFILTLQYHLRGAMTDVVEKAWNNFYDEIAVIMKEVIR